MFRELCCSLSFPLLTVPPPHPATAGSLCSREVRPCPWEQCGAQAGVVTGPKDEGFSVLIQLLGSRHTWA